MIMHKYFLLNALMKKQIIQRNAYFKKTKAVCLMCYQWKCKWCIWPYTRTINKCYLVLHVLLPHWLHNLIANLYSSFFLIANAIFNLLLFCNTPLHGAILVVDHVCNMFCSCSCYEMLWMLSKRSVEGGGRGLASQRAKITRSNRRERTGSHTPLSRLTQLKFFLPWFFV